MRIPGNLRSTTLGDLLGMLYRANSSGTLELIETKGAVSGRSHRVQLTQGLVDNVETPLPVERLGEILRAEGLVSRQVLDRLMARIPLGRRPFGQVLLRERVVSRDALCAALRYQVKRRLDSVFTLQEASVRFRVPRPRVDRAVPLSPREFLFGRPRFRPGRGSGTLPSVRHASSERQLALRTLNLAPRATPEEIRQAFRLLAQQSHPDRFPGAGPARKQALMQQFARLSAAYHVLMT